MVRLLAYHGDPMNDYMQTAGNGQLDMGPYHPCPLPVVGGEPAHLEPPHPNNVENGLQGLPSLGATWSELQRRHGRLPSIASVKISMGEAVIPHMGKSITHWERQPRAKRSRHLKMTRGGAPSLLVRPADPGIAVSNPKGSKTAACIGGVSRSGGLSGPTPACIEDAICVRAISTAAKRVAMLRSSKASVVEITSTFKSKNVSQMVSSMPSRRWVTVWVVVVV